MVLPNDAARGKPRIRVQELLTRADATRGAVLRARVIGRLGPYLVYRFVIVILAAVTAWVLAVRDALTLGDDGDLAGPLVLGLIALVLTVIIVLIAYELVVGQPIRAVETNLNAIGGRVAVADLDRFEVAASGDRADLRAVQHDGRRVDVALGIDPGDARALISLLESVLHHSPTQAPHLTGPREPHA
jgi:hypothetical protein